MDDDPAARSTHLVMDVGGGHVTAAAVALTQSTAPGRAVVLARSSRPLDSSGDRSTILETLATAARQMIVPAARWTIAMPGPFDYARGVGSFAGIGKFDAVAGVDLRTELAARLDTPPERVRFLNDAAAAGIGEWAFGQDGPSPRRLVCLTLGTGVGSAFVEDGAAVATGNTVPREGAAYTIEHDGRPLEESVSTRAIRRRYAEQGGDGDERSGDDHEQSGGGDGPSVAVIARRATAGDEVARAVFSDRMTVLGRAVGPWIERFGASVLVVGGAISQSWPLLETGLRAGLAESMRTPAVPEVRPSRLLDDAPLLGAAAWARRATD